MTRLHPQAYVFFAASNSKGEFMRAMALTACTCLAILSVPARARTGTLGTWSTSPATHGGWTHSGIAAARGHLYTATSPAMFETARIRSRTTLDPWQVVQPPNLFRTFAITLAWRKHLYIAGGFANGVCCGTNTSTVEAATVEPDGTLSPWAYTAPMNLARGNQAGAVGAGRLYMLGNYGGSASVESAAIQSDGSLAPWRYEPSMNQARERPAAAVVGKFLYAIGGLPFTTSVERALIGTDGQLRPWVYVAPTQVARYHVGAAAIGHFLFAVGGYDDALGPFASIEVAQSSATGLSPWTYLPPMPLPCPNCDATSHGRTVYAAGTGNGTSVVFATLSSQ